MFPTRFGVKPTASPRLARPNKAEITQSFPPQVSLKFFSSFILILVTVAEIPFGAQTPVSGFMSGGGSANRRV
jgi:hypothetical protein